MTFALDVALHVRGVAFFLYCNSTDGLIISVVYHFVLNSTLNNLYFLLSHVHLSLG